MKEQECGASTDAVALVKFLGSRISQRKLRLWACACCRRIQHLLTDPGSLLGLETAERYADGQCGERELILARAAAVKAANAAFDARYVTLVPVGSEDPWGSWGYEVCADASSAAQACYSATADDCARLVEAARDAAQAVAHAVSPLRMESVCWTDTPERHAARTAEVAAQADLLRDIFGVHPFRPVHIDPCWRTPAVLTLATGIYVERAFDRLPILADALLDLGCADPDILNHCYSPGPHVRGCFVVDLLLGKN